MAAAGSTLTSFFHGNSRSVSADPVSVLVATSCSASVEHIHVLNRRNYCKIPEIESPSSSHAIIIQQHRREKADRIKRLDLCAVQQTDKSSEVRGEQRYEDGVT